MANSSKNIWIIIACFAAGGLFLLLTMQHKPQEGQPVVMQDVLKQTPETKADPVPSPAIVTSPVDGKEAGFTIQVYSFMDKARADKALDNLKQAGYKPFMEISDLGEKGTYYRVRISGIDNEAQAKKLLDEIRKNYKSGFIVKPKA